MGLGIVNRKWLILNRNDKTREQVHAKTRRGAKNYPQMTQIGKKAEGNTKRQKPNEKCQNGER
jgi:hypothetical protein